MPPVVLYLFGLVLIVLLSYWLVVRDKHQPEPGDYSFDELYRVVKFIVVALAAALVYTFCWLVFFLMR